MPRSQQQSVKRAQKESVLFQEFSKLFLHILLDDEQVRGLSITRVKLADDGSICTIFFYTPGGLEAFKEKRNFLILYKPSLRKAIARAIPARYTPELVFRFDDTFEKQQRIEQILDTIKEH